jgi:transcriptional regulator with XRE-family HTH domain
MPIDGGKIEQYRKRLGLTMADAGRKAGFRKQPSSAWLRLETGRRANPSCDTLLAVAKVLGVSMEDLMQ